mgnify:CR=1 FL=1
MRVVDAQTHQVNRRPTTDLTRARPNVVVLLSSLDAHEYLQATNVRMIAAKRENESPWSIELAKGRNLAICSLGVRNAKGGEGMKEGRVIAGMREEGERLQHQA